MKNFFSRVLFHTKQITVGIIDRKLTIYSASSCYFMFLALVPIFMIICCLLPYTPLNQAMVIGYIDEFVDKSISHVLHNIINAIYRSNSATLTVSIFLTLFSASFAMKAVMKGMDSAYGCKNNTNFIVYTIRSLIYMVALVFTMLIAFFIMALGDKIFDILKTHLPDWRIIETLRPLLSKSRYLNVMIVLFLIFLIFYWLMPDKKVRLLEQIPGAIFSAVIWVIFSVLFSLYVNTSGKFGAFGVIGSVMLTMLWGNFCLLFLLIGGFLNSYISDYRAEKKKNI